MGKMTKIPSAENYIITDKKVLKKRKERRELQDKLEFLIKQFYYYLDFFEEQLDEKSKVTFNENIKILEDIKEKLLCESDNPTKLEEKKIQSACKLFEKLKKIEDVIDKKMKFFIVTEEALSGIFRKIENEKKLELRKEGL